MAKQLLIPLETKPYYNTDTMANAMATDDMYDCYLESVPGVGLITRRRPGLVEFADTGTDAKGDGLIYWDAANLVIAVSGGKAFDVSSHGACSELTGTFPSTGINTTFASGQSLDGTPWLYMAANGLVYTTNGVSLITPTDPNTPHSTHVGWINGRFIANEPGTNRFDFTDTNPITGEIENDYWSATDNPLTCEARGDLLSGLFTAWQEIYLWGTEGLEIWQDDSVTPFSPVQGAFAEAGLEGPYAFGRIDNTIFALCVIDGKRVVIKMDKRSPSVVSEPIARVLSELITVSDATCDIISVGGLAIAMFSFPTDNQTWAYDYKNDIWLRWGNYDSLSCSHDMFLGQHSCFVKTWNKHLIQSRLDGKIYELRRDTFLDGTNPLVSYRRTGWVDYGTWKRKRVSQLFVKVKVFPRGVSDSTLQVRWRDDGNPTWSTLCSFELNPTMQGDFIVPMNRMGIFRSRQYEFRMSDNNDFVLVGAWEDIEVMRN